MGVRWVRGADAAGLIAAAASAALVAAAGNGSPGGGSGIWESRGPRERQIPGGQDQGKPGSGERQAPGCVRRSRRDGMHFVLNCSPYRCKFVGVYAAARSTGLCTRMTIPLLHFEETILFTPRDGRYNSVSRDRRITQWPLDQPPNATKKGSYQSVGCRASD